MSPRPNVEDQRRREILQAACAAISELGFAAVRIADVAERAGTSTGTVHYYFDSKQDVLHQALRFAFEKSLARQAEELATVAGARDRLVKIIDMNLPVERDVVDEWVVWMEFWIEALHRPELRPVNEELYGHWRDLVEKTILDGQANGEFDPTADARDLAHKFVALLDGLAIQVLLHSPKMTAPDMRRVCVDLIETELMARPPAASRA